MFYFHARFSLKCGYSIGKSGRHECRAGHRIAVALWLHDTRVVGGRLLLPVATLLKLNLKCVRTTVCFESSVIRPVWKHNCNITHPVVLKALLLEMVPSKPSVLKYIIVYCLYSVVCIIRDFAINKGYLFKRVCSFSYILKNALKFTGTLNSSQHAVCHCSFL